MATEFHNRIKVLYIDNNTVFFYTIRKSFLYYRNRVYEIFRLF